MECMYHTSNSHLRTFIEINFSYFFIALLPNNSYCMMAFMLSFVQINGIL